MAKVKFSALVSDMRNKLNGSVASKNRYGNYLRNKVTPVNPQTSYQQAVRQLLGALSSQYRGLTDAQRLSWINGAANYPFTDIFGDVRYLSGQTLFIKLNTNLINAGESVITTAPLPVGIPEMAVTGLTAEVTTGSLVTLDLDASAATVPNDFVLAVYATPPTPASIQFVKNRYRFIGLATVAAGEADILSMYIDRFGSSANEGEQIHVRAALISDTTGQQGVPSAASDTITTAM